jgi:membrane-bound lytic murein transglycosylase B
MIKRLTLIALLFANVFFLQNGSAATPAQIQSFVDEIHKLHGMDKQMVTDLLKQARHQQEIIDKMGGRAEKKGWYQYRPIFMTQQRIDKGVRFWRDNQALLNKAERDYGVPPEVIVAILGVETLYGERTGKTRVLDALYTLAFGYPRRAAFFRKELMHFIVLSRQAGFDPTRVTGSYAGAMGMTQFISSSYRHYAIDYDGDGRTHLWDSKADIIGSVANYFKRNGWHPGDLVAVKASGVDPIQARKLLFSDGKRPLKEVVLPKDKPNNSLTELAQLGIKPITRANTRSKAYLMPFEISPGKFDYWLGFHNFYVITRYNRSPLYAMAVHQLSREIKRQHDRTQPKHKPIGFL